MLEKGKILIIEDDAYIGDILTYSLIKEGYCVRYASTGKKGLEVMEDFQPDLLLLDIMLPDTDGFEICKRVASAFRIPILMITARNDIIDKILGLELGADDYITKPFEIREVISRVKVALRRVEQYSGSWYEDKKGRNLQEIIELTSSVRIEKASRKVFKGERELQLKPREYDLLILLAENRGRVFSREQLIDSVWGVDFEGDFRTVDVHIQRLRKKLEDTEGETLIETVFGVGYRMRCSA